MKKSPGIPLSILAGSKSPVSAAEQIPPVPVSEPPPGPFQPTDESLEKYQCPDWFRDAKFGIWSHWGPQAVPRRGDWYARRLYVNQQIDQKTGENKGPDPIYTHHVEHYGHPSKFGYKDIIPLWKAEKWEPEKLMALYKKVGAKYFVSMGAHHDNFFLWDSKIHRWNSVQMGPKKDVVGIWQKAAKKEGLPFGVSEHLAASYTWFQSSHGADVEGPVAGIPYDGNDPQYQDLYHAKAVPGDDAWLTTNPVWHRQWFLDLKELVEAYHPDLIYSDSKLPFGDVGLGMVANFYNENIAANGGRLEAVYNCKESSGGKWVRDIERGVDDHISEDSWQTDTSIGDWFYSAGQKYMSAGEVVRMLIDIVSKNGNLLLNVVQTPEGDLEPDVLGILDEIADWMAVNGEGIYATRPWKVYGEGPSTHKDQQQKGLFDGLKDVPDKAYTQADFRFTTSKDGAVLYAFCLAPPTKDIRIASLGSMGGLTDKAIASVELLGGAMSQVWEQERDALVIEPPGLIPSRLALAYKITFQP